MTDDELSIASIPAASDLLEERGLPGAAGLLREVPAKAALLERAVASLEERIGLATRIAYVFNRPATDWADVRIIAEHRGETPEATLARLGPAPVTLPMRTSPPVVDGGMRIAWQMPVFGRHPNSHVLADCGCYTHADEPPAPPDDHE